MSVWRPAGSPASRALRRRRRAERLGEPACDDGMKGRLFVHGSDAQNATGFFQFTPTGRESAPRPAVASAGAAIAKTRWAAGSATPCVNARRARASETVAVRPPADPRCRSAALSRIAPPSELAGVKLMFPIVNMANTIASKSAEGVPPGSVQSMTRKPAKPTGSFQIHTLAPWYPAASCSP